jgi:uncharacterized protein (DUF1501 family)
MILGGDVNGGRVIADWPGLSTNNLYEGRDLKPTTNLNTLFASIAGAGFDINPDRISKTLFPETNSRKAIEGLLRS